MEKKKRGKKKIIIWAVLLLVFIILVAVCAYGLYSEYLFYVLLKEEMTDRRSQIDSLMNQTIDYLENTEEFASNYRELYSNESTWRKELILMMEFLKLQETNSRCFGIEHYFTNDSFIDDKYHMERQYRKCYNSTEVDYLPHLLKPQDLYECKTGYDCEDFSYAVKCLAEMYDIECKYYVQLRYYEWNQDSGGHVGIYCYLENDDLGGEGTLMN